MIWKLFLSVISVLSACPVFADLSLPSVFSNNMVLQRECEAAVWGKESPGTEVTVSFRGEQRKSESDGSGGWKVMIPTGNAGGPYEMTVAGSSSVTLKNIMVGEVWIAGGQSNMWWAVSRSSNFKDEKAAAADFSQVRIYDGNNAPREAGWHKDEPVLSIEGASWAPASPQSVGAFPAAAYFFAKDLTAELKVPVGIVHIAVPGSTIEPFIQTAYMKENLPDIYNAWVKDTEEYPAKLEAYQQTDAYKEYLEKKKANPKARKPKGEPANPRKRKPGTFYNGMVVPVAGFTAKGFIWWQGESNAGRAFEYDKLMKALILNWRKAWGNEALPFLLVELHNFGPKQKGAVEPAPWPSLRDAQRKAAAEVEGAEMVCVLDIKEDSEGDWQIHPARKQIAGERLFLAAMGTAYGKDIVWKGPEPVSFEFRESTAVITFKHTGTGMKASDGSDLRAFAVAGKDGKWYHAKAAVEGNTVVCRAEEVPDPVAVRYSWANHPAGNLVNSADLPASAFRSDNW